MIKSGRKESETMKRRILTSILCGLLCLSLSGCSYLEKAFEKGQDIVDEASSLLEEASSAIEGKAADLAQYYYDLQSNTNHEQREELIEWRRQLLTALNQQDADKVKGLFDQSLQQKAGFSDEVDSLLDACTSPVLWFDLYCDSVQEDVERSTDERQDIKGTFYFRNAEGGFYVYLRGTMTDEEDASQVGIHQLDFVPEKAQAAYLAGVENSYAGPDAYEEGSLDGIHVVDDASLTQEARRIDYTSLLYTPASRNLTQQEVISYFRETEDLSYDAFRERFGQPNAQADGSGHNVEIRHAVRYYYELTEADDLYAELTAVDGQIVLVRRMQARMESREMVPTGSSQEAKLNNDLKSNDIETYCKFRLLEGLASGDKEMVRNVFSDYEQQDETLDEQIDRLFELCQGPALEEVNDLGSYEHGNFHMGARELMSWSFPRY